MNYNHLIEYFGSLTKASQALDTTVQVVHNWGKRGRIPSPQQIKVYRITGGQLRPDKAAKRFAHELGLGL